MKKHKPTMAEVLRGLRYDMIGIQETKLAIIVYCIGMGVVLVPFGYCVWLSL